MLSVSAEENTSEQIQVYEEKLQAKDVIISTFATNNSSNKNIYMNLGNTRLSEGNQGLTQIYYIENANYFLANP